MESLVWELTEGMVRDFTELRKKLRLTPYVRRQRKTADLVTSPSATVAI